MATTADYLSELKRQQQKLSDNLNQMGVETEEGEHLNTLVPKVLDVPIKSVGGSFVLAKDTYTVEISGLPFAPRAFYISAYDSVYSYPSCVYHYSYVKNEKGSGMVGTYMFQNPNGKFWMYLDDTTTHAGVSEDGFRAYIWNIYGSMFRAGAKYTWVATEDTTNEIL